MEPFTILCKTCTSRLKVRKASLIGQALACPKCGQMVKVAHPEGWVPEDSSYTNTDINAENFDDIESLIQREQKKPSRAAALPQPTSPAKSPRKSPAKPTTPPPSPTHVAEANEPILPDQNWASSDSKKRQKLTMILAASLAGLLLTIGTITAFVVNSGTGDDGTGTDSELLAKNDTESNDTEPNNSDPTESSKPEEGSDTENNNDANNDAENKIDNATGSPDGSGSTTEPIAINDPADPTTDAELTKGSDTTPGDPSQSPPVATPLVPDLEDTENPKQKTDPLFDLGLEDRNPGLVDPILGDPLGGDTIATRMDKLNSLLADSGVTVGEIGSIADSNRQSELVGIPKYFIEPPATKPANITQQLSNDIAGIQYQNGVSLVDFARDIGSLIGAPVALHVESLNALDLGLDPQLDLMQTDLKLSQAIDVALAEVGMVKLQTELGIVVLAEGWDKTAQHSFDFHKLSDSSPDGLAAFIRKVRGMFADDVWTDQTMIEFQKGKLVVTQNPQAAAQIKTLLNKLVAAQALQTNSNDEAAKRTLQTTWAVSKAARETKTEFRPGVARPIGQFLRDVEKQADVRILIEWNSLAGEGWTPATFVPGQFDEGSVEDTLAQLARGMRVTYRAVGERTFELLTFQEAATRPELQIYSATSIVNESFKSEDLMEILWSTIQVDRNLIQISYDNDVDGVIVIAPQSIQRQFEAVMNRLQPKP